MSHTSSSATVMTGSASRNWPKPRASRMQCKFAGHVPHQRAALTTFVSLTFLSCRAQARDLASRFLKPRPPVCLLSAEIVMGALMRWRRAQSVPWSTQTMPRSSSAPSAMHSTAALGEPSLRQLHALACRISMLMSMTSSEASIERLELASSPAAHDVHEGPGTCRVRAAPVAVAMSIANSTFLASMASNISV